MSRKSSARTGGPWSMGIPEPLNWRPSISVLMGILSTSPVNSQWVWVLSISDVPSKIYTHRSVNAPSPGEPQTRVLLEKGTYLDDCALAGDFEDLALTGLAISELDVDDLGVPAGKGYTSFCGGRGGRRRKLTWGT